MNKITIRRIVETEYSLLRVPTEAEIKLIQRDAGNIFEIDDFINWDDSKDIEEDFSNCKILLRANGLIRTIRG